MHELYKVKNRISRLCTGPFTHVSHYWWKQSFRVFGTDFDRPLARLQTRGGVGRALMLFMHVSAIFAMLAVFATSVTPCYPL